MNTWRNDGSSLPHPTRASSTSSAACYGAVPSRRPGEAAAGVRAESTSRLHPLRDAGRRRRRPPPRPGTSPSSANRSAPALSTTAVRSSTQTSKSNARRPSRTARTRVRRSARATGRAESPRSSAATSGSRARSRGGSSSSPPSPAVGPSPDRGIGDPHSVASTTESDLLLGRAGTAHRRPSGRRCWHASRSPARRTDSRARRPCESSRWVLPSSPRPVGPP